MSFPPVPIPPTAPPAPPGRGYVLGPDEGDAHHWLGTLNLVKVAGAATGGGLDIVEHRVPAGYAPPRHVHDRQDEVFVLLDGELDVTCGDERWRARRGSLVFLPRAVPHGFAAVGPARALLVDAPAGFADLVVELGTPADALALPGADVPVPQPERIAEVSARYGIAPVPPAGTKP